MAWAGLRQRQTRHRKGSVVPAGVKAYPISPRSPETKAPDQKKLDRYVRLYGAEGLSETMDDYGIQVFPSTPTRPRTLRAGE